MDDRRAKWVRDLIADRRIRSQRGGGTVRTQREDASVSANAGVNASEDASADENAIPTYWRDPDLLKQG